MNRRQLYLKLFRVITDTSQAEMAEMLGCDQAQISYWESGKRKPNDESWSNVVKKCRESLNKRDIPTIRNLESLLMSFEIDADRR